MSNNLVNKIKLTSKEKINISKVITEDIFNLTSVGNNGKEVFFQDVINGFFKEKPYLLDAHFNNIHTQMQGLFNNISSIFSTLLINIFKVYIKILKGVFTFVR